MNPDDEISIDNDPLSLDEVIMYETAANWLAPWIWFNWGTTLISMYVISRAKRKHKKYLKLKTDLQKAFANNTQH